MSYTPINAVAAPGVDYAAYLRQLEKQKEYLAANPTVTDGDNSAIYEKYARTINSTLAGLGGNSAVGYYTQDSGEAERAASQYGAAVTPAIYNGQSGWYHVDGADRTVQEGTSGADEDLLSDGSYAVIQQLKAEWDAANREYRNALAAGDSRLAAQYRAAMDQAHLEAESIRASAGYTGGEDGSQYLTLGALGYGKKSGGDSSGTSAAGTASGGSDLTALLEQWKAAAQAQSDGQIDYAVRQAVTALERALADAQPQYKEQAESVYKDEMQALDNSALYAEARGDKGGIGQSQYNEIQAAAAQNRLAVQQAQTRLGTDTARQIEDLRAQGEFEKADAALELSQQYLSQLIALEQWSAEFGLDTAQFEAELDQWQAEYAMELDKLLTDTDLAYGELTGTVPSTGESTLSGKKQLAALGEAMLSAGVMPSADQLAAMGMTEEQAAAYLAIVTA